MMLARVLTYSSSAFSAISEFQKDSPQHLQDPFFNSGDIKQAEKALESILSDFNNYKILHLEKALVIAGENS